MGSNLQNFHGDAKKTRNNMMKTKPAMDAKPKWTEHI